MLLSTVSRVLAIILSEEDERIGSMGQKALTIRSLSNRLAFSVKELPQFEKG